MQKPAGRVAEAVVSSARAAEAAPETVSLRSRVGLNAANFFLAEITGVVMPFLGNYLEGQQWSETAIGVAIALAGLGVFLMQTPAGLIVDRCGSGGRCWPARRSCWASATACCRWCRPARLGRSAAVRGRGGAGVLSAPAGGAGAGLVGHAALNRTMGNNQGWNHAGNIAAALLAMGLVSLFGVTSVFYAVAVVSVLAAGSVFLIREDELDESRASGAADGGGKGAGLRELLRDRRVLVLLAATALFHLANAPVMPFVGAYIKKLGGNDVQVAAVVLVAQAVMIPVALAAGWLCDRWGRKSVFAIGFLALPVRIFLYSLTQDPWVLVALQALDGIGAGIYGVVIVAMCADLTQGQGRLQRPSGMIATALAIGGVIGPLGAGFLAEHLGYNGVFYVFAGIAAVAAVAVPDADARDAAATGRCGEELGARREQAVERPDESG